MIRSPPTMSLAAGARLDTYEIVAPLGSGGVGEAWLATDHRLQRKVAITGNIWTLHNVNR